MLLLLVFYDVTVGFVFDDIAAVDVFSVVVVYVTVVLFDVGAVVDVFVVVVMILISIRRLHFKVN